MLVTQRFTSDVLTVVFQEVLFLFWPCIFEVLFVYFSSLLQINHFYSLFLTGAFLNISRASPTVCIELCYGSGGDIHARRECYWEQQHLILFAALRKTIGCFAIFTNDEILVLFWELLISQLPLDGIKQGEHVGGSALERALLFLKLIFNMGRQNRKVPLKYVLPLYLQIFCPHSPLLTVHAGTNPCLALPPWGLYQQSFHKQISLKIIKTMIMMFSVP